MKSRRAALSLVALALLAAAPPPSSAQWRPLSGLFGGGGTVLPPGVSPEAFQKHAYDLLITNTPGYTGTSLSTLEGLTALGESKPASKEEADRAATAKALAGLLTRRDRKELDSSKLKKLLGPVAWMSLSGSARTLDANEREAKAHVPTAVLAPARAIPDNLLQGPWKPREAGAPAQAAAQADEAEIPGRVVRVPFGDRGAVIRLRDGIERSRRQREQAIRENNLRLERERAEQAREAERERQARFKVSEDWAKAAAPKKGVVLAGPWRDQGQAQANRELGVLPSAELPANVVKGPWRGAPVLQPKAAGLLAKLRRFLQGRD